VTPWKLAIAGIICLVLYLGALQSEGRLGDGEPTGDPNMFTPIFGIAWVVLLLAAIGWGIARRVKRRPRD
jgi:hypothetical protein